MGGKKGEVKNEGEDSAKHIAKKICAEKKNGSKQSKIHTKSRELTLQSILPASAGP